MTFTQDYQAMHPEKEQIMPINGSFPHPLEAKIVEKLNEGKSPNVAFVGDTGNGKSMKALKMVENMYEEYDVFKGSFNPKDNLVYEPVEFLELITSQEMPDPDSDDVNEDREAIIFDEAGVNLNIAEYHNQMNKLFSTRMVCRIWSTDLFIFIAPKIKDLESRIQGRLDYIITVKDQGFALTYYVVEVEDKLDGKVIFKRPITIWKPDMPSEEIEQKYREKEYSFKEENAEELKEKVMEKIREDEEEEFEAQGLY